MSSTSFPPFIASIRSALAALFVSRKPIDPSQPNRSRLWGAQSRDNIKLFTYTQCNGEKLWTSSQLYSPLFHPLDVSRLSSPIAIHQFQATAIFSKLTITFTRTHSMQRQWVRLVINRFSVTSSPLVSLHLKFSNHYSPIPNRRHLQCA